MIKLSHCRRRVINPENGANQTVGAYAGAIEQSINNAGGGYIILDMTDAYQKNAVDVKRNFAYFDRLQVLIRHEYTLKETSDIYWQMHTEADVMISEDGKTAILTQGGETVLLKLIDENGTDLKFQTMAAVAYDGLKTYEGENSNEGVTMIYNLAEDVQTGMFNVLITPECQADPEVKTLENWSKYDFSILNTDAEHTADFTFQWNEDYTSCTATGTCSVCGSMITGACTITVENAEASCTTDGKALYTATYGAYTDVVEFTITATGHNYEAVVTAPTCTEAGHTTYTCANCDDSYVAEEVEATGHSYEAVVTEPTCTEQGYTTFTCHYGDSYVDDYVDATGHTYVDGICIDCGEIDPAYQQENVKEIIKEIADMISKLISWLIGSRPKH